MLTPTHAPGPAIIPAPAHVDSPGERFLTGPGLLVFLFTALAAYEGFLLLTIFGPTEGGLLGDFVRDFQLWCYRGDPRTGGISWLAVSVMMLEPCFIVGAAVVLWRQVIVPLRDPRLWLAHTRAAAAGFGVIAICVAGLVYYARLDAARAQELPPFPGARIRVNLAVPDAPLLDQRGMDFRLADLRGQVVLVTGVYAACSTTCPEIFKEVQALLTEFTAAERADLRVVALSLNPEYETTEIMAAMAEGRGFTYPEFRYVNGRDPAGMRDVLKRLQFSVTRNPETGVLDHANLFLLVDRSGRIAYRFTLDPRHRAWLRAGLRQLLLESHAPIPAQ
ncbi:SCO1/SenC [Lacunisphaera limnophila]|uniref:SCO1/SenC n=1 Tax=Lacunisphaera limnophila TaxID=1838286 RepID=A0A1I7PI58_9BACT|nr:SCO family protein [Lacunisphaera limnophila]AOS43316.1 SCO1/SenC [Lacunisphaera limnophila]